MEILSQDNNSADPAYLKYKAGYVVWGIILPLVGALLNYALAFGVGRVIFFGVIGPAGSKFLLPRVGYWYVIIIFGALTLLLWLVYLRKHRKAYCGLIGGIFLCHAVLDALFTIAAVYRWLIIPVWIIPLGAAVVMFAAGRCALRIAAMSATRWRVVVGAVTGFVCVPLVCLLMVPQPWELVRHLRDAHGADLSGADLHGIYLEGSGWFDWERISFRDADLSGADLHGATLNFLDMQQVNLQGADMRYVAMNSTELKGANLREVNLNGACLYQMNFEGVDLRDASFGAYVLGRTYLTDTNLRGTDFSKAINISRGVYGWEGAIFDATTRWPGDFDPNEYGFVPIENDQGGYPLFVFQRREE